MAQNEDLKDIPSSSTNPPSNPIIRSTQQSHSFSAKIAELFLTAGHAFQKLGDLTVRLNAVNVDHEENRWTEKDIDNLRDAITRFAHELDNVSGSLQTRSKKNIRTDIKRRTLQMGIEPGGTTLAGARTVLKPVSQTDPYLQQTSLSLTNTKLLSAQAQPSSSSEAKPSTSGLQSNLLTSDNANGAGASTSGLASTTTMHTLRNPVLKKVYIPNSGQMGPGIKRAHGSIYGNRPLPNGPSNMRLIPSQQMLKPATQRVVVGASQFVRVLGPNEFERQRQLPPNRRYHLNNGFANEEIVYTSQDSGAQSSTRSPAQGPIKRTITEPSPVGAKAPKLEAAES